jgi:hypothetical protein
MALFHGNGRGYQVFVQIPQPERLVTPRSTRARLGISVLRALLWWPAIAAIWFAAIPQSSPGVLVGIGVGLALLGLIDAMVGQPGGRRAP